MRSQSGSISASPKLLLIIACAIFAWTAAPSGGSAFNHSGPKDTVAYRHLLDRYQAADRDALRIRDDKSRNRVWVLTLENLYVYDTAAHMLLRRIRLPAWSVADFDYALAPDLAIDHRGAAFISSNVEPRLLEVDPSNFQTKEHRLRLISPKQWETGFGSLQFARDGALLAVSATGRAFFRIDLRSGSAQEVYAR